MDNFSAPPPFSSSSSSSSQNHVHMHQNVAHHHHHHYYFQVNHQHFSPTPYFLPYVQNSQIPNRDPPFLQVNPPFYCHPAVSYFPMAPASNNIVVGHGMVPTTTRESTDESERKKKGTMMSKIARTIRKEARQRTKSSSSTTSRVSPSVLEQPSRQVASRRSMGDNIVRRNEIHSGIPDILHSLDGKKLKKLFTKKLKLSDVRFPGRIVLPKYESEKNLPALSDKEGIQVVLKDVCTNQQWRMKYKYWVNNKSRMYLLENTGNFVKHYQLKIGDSITLYEDDELKTLYVLPRKEEAAEEEDGQQQLFSIKEEKNDDTDDMLMMPAYKQEKYDFDNEEETPLGKFFDEILITKKEH